MGDLNEAKKTLLAEWERKRDEYASLASALRREMGMESAETPKSEASASVAPGTGIDVNQLVRPGDFFGKTQVDAIDEFLKRTNKQTATLQEIAAALYRGKATNELIEGDKLKNLSSLLSKTDTVFFPVARGRWGLADWYPGKQKTKRAKDAGLESGKTETSKPENEKASA